LIDRVGYFLAAFFFVVFLAAFFFVAMGLHLLPGAVRGRPSFRCIEGEYREAVPGVKTLFGLATVRDA